MTNFGIAAYGAYIPRLRLQRQAIAAAHAWALPGLKSAGKGEKAICNWDEDPITMAVEAARDCLADRNRLTINAVTFGSTTPPFIDRQNATIIGAALGLPEAISTLDVVGSMRAATSALRRALESREQTLIVAAEDRLAKPGSMQEMNYGAGAAAMLVDDDEPVARYLGGHSTSVDFVDHYRTPDMKFDYAWEDRWIRDEGYAKIVPSAIAALLERLNVPPEKITHTILAATLGGAAVQALKKTDIRSETLVDPLFTRIGDTGTAHPLLLLAATLQKSAPGDLILLIGFGQGCDVLLFEATAVIAKTRPLQGVDGMLNRGVTEASYNRMLGFQGTLGLDVGIRGEFTPKTALTEQYRSGGQVAAFVAGRCKSCHTVQFPQLAVCIRCSSSLGYDPVPLADASASIATFTLDHLSSHPSPPFKLGLVQFDNGARMMMEFTDTEPTDLSIGLPLRMVFRIKDYDHTRSYRKYFWKATPARAG
jgi:3-hydroxy-3-methylglutaryl CoA synthase/uncharacterized OB-fold protein